MSVKLVVALVGLPGSGKSTLAGPLCARFGLRLIDRDALRAELFHDCGFTAEEKEAANTAVFEQLHRHCSQGKSCLIDGMTFGRATERSAARVIAGDLGAQFLALWLDCPVELAVARVATDIHPAKDRNAKLVREVAARFEPPLDALRLDATLPAAEIQQIAARLVAAVI